MELYYKITLCIFTIRYLYMYSLNQDTLMKRTILMGLIMAAIGTTIAATLLIPVTTAFAQNEFGQAAKDAAPLGEHSKAGGVACDPPFTANPLTDPPCQQDGTQPFSNPGRLGIGNTGEVVCPNVGKLTPSELAIFLGGGGCPTP
jgi:hypothetical protein